MKFFAATEYITNFCFILFDLDRAIPPSLSPKTGGQRHHVPLPWKSGTYSSIINFLLRCLFYENEK